jgi:acetylornithine deacetylase/succinyl-diaminopimelate desuccinylase-like protein
MVAVTPALCRIRLDLRIAPGTTPLQVKRELTEFVGVWGRDLGVEMVLSVPPSHTPPDAPIVRRAVRAWESLHGRPPPSVPDNSGATDANILRARGIPTVRIGMDKAVSDDFTRGMNTVDVRAMRGLCAVLARIVID